MRPVTGWEALRKILRHGPTHYRPRPPNAELPISKLLPTPYSTYLFSVIPSIFWQHEFLEGARNSVTYAFRVKTRSTLTGKERCQTPK